MPKELIFEYITSFVAWVTSLGTAGTFMVLALLGKLTKTVLKLLGFFAILAILFWLMSIPNFREGLVNLFRG